MKFDWQISRPPCEWHESRQFLMANKTGLQPVEQVNYFGGWVEGDSPFGANALQTTIQDWWRCYKHKTFFFLFKGLVPSSEETSF